MTSAQAAGPTASPTTTLLFFDTDNQRLAASVVAADASATTYLVNCVGSSPFGSTSSPPLDCGVFNETVVQGSSTYHASFTLPVQQTSSNGYAIDCSLRSGTPTKCTTTSAGQTVTLNSVAQTVYGYLPVTITAGYDKIVAVTNASAAGPFFTPTSTSSHSGAAARMTQGVDAVGGIALGGLLLGIFL